MNIWDELGLAPTEDRERIRRAYAKRLKQVHPEDDPDGFQRLRQAYEQALAAAGDDGASATRPTCPDASDVARAHRTAAEPDLPASSLEAVDAAAESVAAKLAADDLEGALTALERALHDPDLAAVERRRVLEQRLLAALPPDRATPTDLIEALAAAFDWRDDPRHLPPMAEARARCLLAERDALGRLEALRRRRRRQYRILLFDKRPLATALLLGPCRPRLFALLALDRQVLATATGLVGELDSLHPALFDRELDPETIAWWRRALHRPRGAVRRLVGYLLDARWLYGALALTALKLAGVTLPTWLLIPAAGLLGLALGWDLYPLIVRGVGRADAGSRRLPAALRRAFLPALALAAAGTALVTAQPYDGIAALAAFFCFLFLSADPESDVVFYVFGAFGLFLGAMGLIRLGLLPELPMAPLFLAAQVSTFAGLRLWRRAQRRTAPRERRV